MSVEIRSLQKINGNTVVTFINHDIIKVIYTPLDEVESVPVIVPKRGVIPSVVDHRLEPNNKNFATLFVATPDGIVGQEDFEIYQLPIALQDVMNKNLEEIKEIEGRQLC
jgi:hypothetical protein